jgi:hypothetical protein
MPQTKKTKYGNVIRYLQGIGRLCISILTLNYKNGRDKPNKRAYIEVGI